MSTLPRSIRRVDGKLEIVDQLQLPHVTEYVQIKDISEAHAAIKSMKIRGAPAIASLAALSVADHLSKALKDPQAPLFLESNDSLKAHVQPLLDYLFTARPTAVNLGAAMGRLGRLLDSSIQEKKDPRTIAEELVKDGQLIADEDLERNRRMGKNGGDWLQTIANAPASETFNVLTVCNTGSLATSGYGTALGLITYLHEIGKLSRAYYTQTAPYHQGSRLTSYELKTLQIPSTMICDTMVGSLFQHHKVHAVAVGADRIARNGDTANKIGTYNAAVLAQRHKIPFVVVAPISTVDLDTPDGDHIPIEHRPPQEACTIRGTVVSLGATSVDSKRSQATVVFTPEGIDVYNPSFDVTPAELISAIVTEKGVATKQEGESFFDLSGVV